jgi:hypothetical protein
MHPKSKSAIDSVFEALNQISNKNCFVRELYYLGPEVRGFLGEFPPEAEIGISGTNTLYAKWGELHGREAWSWTPVYGWKQHELADDTLRHPWEHGVLQGVDTLDTLGGIDAGDPFL